MAWWLYSLLFVKEFIGEVATNFAGEIYGGRYSKGGRYSEGIQK